MDMEDIVKLIVFIIFGVGVLMGISNQLMNTDQNLVSIVNQTINPFQNNTPVTLTTYDIVPNSGIVYGGTNTSLMVLNQGNNYSFNYNGGTITLINSTPQDWYNNTRINVTYQIYPAAYVEDSRVRTIYAAILPLLAILVLLGGWYHFRNV